MNEIQAKKIDEVLHLISNQPSATKNPMMFIDAISVQLDWSKEEVDDIISLIDQLNFSGSPIAKIGVMQIANIANARFIRATYNTEQFLSIGGCIEHFKKVTSEQKKQNEIKALEEQKLLNDIASYKITKRQYFWTIGLAVAGFILAIVSLIIQIFGK